MPTRANPALPRKSRPPDLAVGRLVPPTEPSAYPGRMDCHQGSGMGFPPAPQRQGRVDIGSPSFLRLIDCRHGYHLQPIQEFSMGNWQILTTGSSLSQPLSGPSIRWICGDARSSTRSSLASATTRPSTSRVRQLKTRPRPKVTAIYLSAGMRTTLRRWWASSAGGGISWPTSLRGARNQLSSNSFSTGGGVRAPGATGGCGALPAPARSSTAAIPAVRRRPG